MILGYIKYSFICQMFCMYVLKLKFFQKMLPRRDEKSTQAVEKNKFPAPRIFKKHVPGYQKTMVWPT